MRRFLNWLGSRNNRTEEQRNNQNNNNNNQQNTGTRELINSVSFSPDGRYLVTGSTNPNIRIWDTSNFREIEPRTVAQQNNQQSNNNRRTQTRTTNRRNNVTDSTPLSWASQNNNLEIVRLLLGNGARETINAINNNPRMTSLPLRHGAQNTRNNNRRQTNRRNPNISRNNSNNEAQDIKNTKYFKECSICLEEFKNGENITELGDCKHKFHTKCILPWLDEKGTCPNCRKKTKKNFKK